MINSSESKILLFADQDIGYYTLEFILSEFKSSLAGVVTIGDNEIKHLAEANKISHFNFNFYKKGWTVDLLPKADYVILAWWPKIIGNEIINHPKNGVINFHPSFLPFNRGKNYNFWSIVEKCKFGVSLHFVDDGIDTGDILFQKEILKDWEDTGETLFLRAKFEMLSLFKENFENILKGKYSRVKQDQSIGSFHFERELNAASRLDLDKMVKTEDLLNLLRARTFSGKPSCFFIQNDTTYEVRISITKKNN